MNGTAAGRLRKTLRWQRADNKRSNGVRQSDVCGETSLMKAALNPASVADVSVTCKRRTR